MRTKKPAGLASPSGLLRLGGHAVMGVAIGLAFALVLILVDPAGTASLVAHGGSQAITLFVGPVVLMFAIGATLTGAVFIMMEDH